jgi:DNA-binding NtrC family response regulator
MDAKEGPPEDRPAGADECCLAAGEEGGLRERLRRYEVKLILGALDAAGGNQTEAARRLKVPLRTLAYKMKMLGIKRRGYAPG